MEGLSMRVGLSSYAYRWAIQKGAMDIDGFLQMACDLGVPCVQICENLPFVDLTSEERYRIGSTFGSSLEIETGFRGNTLGSIIKALVATHEMGARAMRLIIDDIAVANQGFDKVIRTMESIVPELEKYGVDLCIENHFGLSPKKIRELIEALDTDRVSVCFDCFNSIVLNIGVNEALDVLLPFTTRMHVKDVEIKRSGTGFTITGCQLGTGVLDIPSLLYRCLDAGKRPTIFLEGWLDERATQEETFEAERNINEEGILAMRAFVLDALAGA